MLSSFDRMLRLAPLAVATFLMVGCGGDKWAANRPDPVPVSGTVLHNGEPVEGATVTFVPQSHQYAASGRTDAMGQFTLRPFRDMEGAVPGEYLVSVTKVERSSAGSPPATDDAVTPEPTETWLLPGRYSDANTSGLTASVPEEGVQGLVFDLAGAPGPPSPAARGGGGSGGGQFNAGE